MTKDLENRQYPRYEQDYSAVVSDGEETSFSAVIENVSKTGVKLTTSETMKKNQPIDLIICKQDSPLDPIKAKGKVIWQAKNGSENHVGVHFTTIRWSETKRLVSNLHY